MKISKPLLAAALFLSGLASSYAANDGTCQIVAGLGQGFKMNAYEQCRANIEACPKNGAYINSDCVKKAMTAPECSSLLHIANAIQVSGEMITVKKKGNLDLLQVSFTADGGQLYYILGAKGCLIATDVDPRVLNSALKRQYAKTDFYIESSEPVYSQQGNRQRFMATVELKNQCRACAIIGNAKVDFEFDKNGNWLQTRLLHFAAG